jgi:hypothetical protein
MPLVMQMLPVDGRINYAGKLRDTLLGTFTFLIAKYEP